MGGKGKIGKLIIPDPRFLTFFLYFPFPFFLSLPAFARAKGRRKKVGKYERRNRGRYSPISTLSPPLAHESLPNNPQTATRGGEGDGAISSLIQFRFLWTFSLVPFPRLWLKEIERDQRK